MKNYSWFFFQSGTLAQRVFWLGSTKNLHTQLGSLQGWTFSTHASLSFCSWSETRWRREGAEVRLQQCSFTRILMDMPVPAEMRQTECKAISREEGDVWRTIPMQCRQWWDHTYTARVTTPPAFFSSKLNLLSKTPPMSFLVDVPGTGWCRGFMGMGRSIHACCGKY